MSGPRVVGRTIGSLEFDLLEKGKNNDDHHLNWLNLTFWFYTVVHVREIIELIYSRFTVKKWQLRRYL